MRRLAAITTFVVFAVLTSAFAQHGGMRASSGSHGGGGRSSGVHASMGMHSGPAIGASRSFSGFHGNGFGGRQFRGRSFRRCLGCGRGIGYPWYSAFGYSGYYDPYWWWNSSSSYDYNEDEAREVELANQMNSASLEEQRLREREDRDRERDEDRYVRRAPRGDERASASVPSPSTALVFRDEHVEEVRNYAIAGSTLWILNERAAKKIPLAQLDLPATVKMNDERGVDFQVPK